MSRFDLYKTLSYTTERLRQLSVFNPFTIRRKGTRAKAIFALALVCFFWGTTWIASREGVRHMPALQLAGIRQLLGGTCYVAFFLYRGIKLPRGREWWPVIILSLLNFTLSNGLSTWGVQYISSGLGAIMAATFPLWIVIIGLFSQKERLPPKAFIGLLLGFGGVCIIFCEHLHDFLMPGFRFGIVISLIATWTWAFGTIYTKKQAVRFNPYFSLGLQMMISGILLTVVTRLMSSPSVPSAIPVSDIPWQSWAAIGFLVVFGSLLSFIAYLYALQNLPASQTSLYAYVNPIVAVLAGWVIFHEIMSPFIIVGTLVTLLGVFVVNKVFRSMPPPEQPEAEGM